MKKLFAVTMVFLSILLSANVSYGATVYTKQPGIYDMCKTAAGAIKYVCVTNTGCPTSTIKCVKPTPPVVVPPVVTPPVVTPPVVVPPVVVPPIAQCTPPEFRNDVTGKCETHTPTPCPSGSTDPACVTPPVNYMPVVDTSKNMPKAAGIDFINHGSYKMPEVGDGDGQFRIMCLPSHMSNDDPIVHPNEPGAAHHHTFFGNTSVNAFTDPMLLATVGNSTCQGGIANRSAYWSPSMFDTQTGAPMMPWQGVWYYKTEYVVPHQFIQPFPKSLRMITGKATNTVKETGAAWYQCSDSTGVGGPQTQEIPACPPMKMLSLHIKFPQCWDGVNLDSPNHISHMAEARNDIKTFNHCPLDHPVALPGLSLHIRWNIPPGQNSQTWRLSSDNYPIEGLNGGRSAHADFINGWDETVMKRIVTNCLNGGKNCEMGLLGDTALDPATGKMGWDALWPPALPADFYNKVKP